MDKCKPNEHQYFPATFESYVIGPKAIQKATSLVCAKCLDIKYIQDVEVPKDSIKQEVVNPVTDIKNELKND